MAFSGRVYDGPWEGRSYTCERPYFEISLPPSGLARCFSTFEEPPSMVSIERRMYRWSQALRAWVFCWNGTSNRYMYEAYSLGVA